MLFLSDHHRRHLMIFTPPVVFSSLSFPFRSNRETPLSMWLFVLPPPPLPPLPPASITSAPGAACSRQLALWRPFLHRLSLSQSPQSTADHLGAAFTGRRYTPENQLDAAAERPLWPQKSFLFFSCAARVSQPSHYGAKGSLLPEDHQHVWS